MQESKTDRKIMTHASLFSGIGAAELAATWMGWKNLFHCDINEIHRDTKQQATHGQLMLLGG